MKYPKLKATTFVQLSEYDCVQVNMSKGRLYNYWWIQPNDTPIKLKKGEVSDELVGYDLSELGNF